MTSPFDLLGAGLTDMVYAIGVAGGHVEFDIPAMQAIVTRLDAQLASIAGAKMTAAQTLAHGDPLRVAHTQIVGVDLASNWLTGTAVEGFGGQVSFQENLDELEKLITSLREKLAGVIAAYSVSDADARAVLDRATAQTFNNDQKATPLDSSLDPTVAGG